MAGRPTGRKQRARFEEPGGTEQLLTAEQTVFGAPEISVENVLEQGSVAWVDLTIDEPLDSITLFEGEEE